MADIEPDLCSSNIDRLEELYPDESKIDKEARLERYEKGFELFENLIKNMKAELAELNALLDQNPQEPKNAPPVVAQRKGPTNAPPVPFRDEVPPEDPLTAEQLQAELKTLLQDEEPKGPDVVGAN